MADLAFAMSVLLAAFVCVTALPALPQQHNKERKCSPMQLEAVVQGTVGQVIQGKGYVLTVEGVLSSDYKEGVQAVVENVTASDGTLVGYYRFLSTAKTSYFIDLDKKQCLTLPGSEVQQLCTDSPFLTHVSSMMMGTQMTDTYRTEKLVYGKAILTVFRDSFTVATQVMEQQLGGGPPQLDALQFGNMTLGIKDRNVFNVPSFCQHTRSKMVRPVTKHAFVASAHSKL